MQVAELIIELRGFIALEPLNGELTAYLIQAVVESGIPIQVTAYATAPNSMQYAVCTTIRYGFKLSQNSVTLMVEAPKTDTTVFEPASPEDTVTVTQDDESTTVTIPPAKTPEQMQQEAGDK